MKHYSTLEKERIMIWEMLYDLVNEEDESDIQGLKLAKSLLESLPVTEPYSKIPSDYVLSNIMNYSKSLEVFQIQDQKFAFLKT